MATSLERATPKIRSKLASSKGGVFTARELMTILAQHRYEWDLANSVSGRTFIEYLVERTSLRAVELRSEHHGRVTRYAWGDYSPFIMALSIRRPSYLSHGTAVFLHGLNLQLPKTIYANKEQSEKPQGAELTQERLTLAFSGRQRASTYIFNINGHRVVLLSGKHSVQLGVVSVKGPAGEELSATGIQRTLIDIVVRPAYAGGVVQVLEAYRGAKGRFEVGELVRLLRRLDYVYPYHQAIGFLMERAEYPSQDCAKLRRLGTRFDFYLTHGMKKAQFNKKWRLFFPEGF